jgi:hypothetical protein
LFQGTSHREERVAINAVTLSGGAAVVTKGIKDEEMALWNTGFH